MTKGRKPKPTKLKVIQGTFRKDRANPNEPIPETEIPSPPDFLNADALQEWGRMSEKLYQLGMLAEIDRGIFAGYCEAYGEWAVAKRTIAEVAKKNTDFHGLLIRTKAGNIIQNPLIGQAHTAHKLMLKNAEILGIPATMRGRVQSLGNKKQTKKEGFAQFS